ncbi:class I SAM-dependent methyltransferase [Salinibacter ruber]|uniref:class I SAM-dependent methyltransferase n=1 Tax=Salinibacter ruber TaxID=146919 RepID=UPI00160A1183|nr:class I SAM-dependent methyltransferase [Salinibacter ruber]MBB4091315.1 SAM-dependent methyltransferase [Salinibacter ruber]
MSLSPSDELLRTLAPVPVSSPVLDLGCGAGDHTEALLRLGFPVHACDPRPEAVQDTQAVVRDLVDEETAETCVQQLSLQGLDELEATFDWVIADRTEALVDSPADLATLLNKSQNVLAPGGWVYLTVPATTEGPDGASHDDTVTRFAPADLDTKALDIALMESQAPSRVEENGEVRVHALYRHVRRPTPK